MNLERLLLDVAEGLRIPVLVFALLALAMVLVELGAFAVERRRRRRRDPGLLTRAADGGSQALALGDTASARRLLDAIAIDRDTAASLAAIVAHHDSEDRLAKELADFELRSTARLERVRLLVRAGPALGLMGTLIPLSPALEALGEGDVRSLAGDLRVAFGVTVVGILVGMVAHGIALVRDRMYAQDYSDLEYVAARLASARRVGDAVPADTAMARA